MYHICLEWYNVSFLQKKSNVYDVIHTLNNSLSAQVKRLQSETEILKVIIVKMIINRKLVLWIIVFIVFQWSFVSCPEPTCPILYSCNFYLSISQNTFVCTANVCIVELCRGILQGE